MHLLVISNCAPKPDVVTEVNTYSGIIEVEEDDMTNTAITFILLFLLALVFSIGTTAIKVTC